MPPFIPLPPLSFLTSIILIEVIVWWITAAAAGERSQEAALLPGSVTIHFSTPPFTFVAVIAALLLDILEDGVTDIIGQVLFPH